METTMSTRFMTLTALPLAAVLLATTAMAQTGGPGVSPGSPAGGGSRMFERLDTDGDGKITQQELQAVHHERFSRADVNNDGKVTRDEFMASRTGQGRRPERGEAMFRRLDADNDGVVTRAESDARSHPRLSKLDANGDGVITRDEAAQARQAKRGRGGPGAWDRPAGPGGRPPQ
jgi:Ca2+-binding EF-hand superfamily protein